MSSYDADAEREEFQRRSDAYQPDVAGPLVKPREPISTLLTEYQNADPLFLTKLTALAPDHPFFRAMKGDGTCGWRAGVFGYFEVLLALKSAAKIQTEMARLRAFNDGLLVLNYDFDMIGFAMDETFDFMQDMASRIITGDTSETKLLETFNDQYTSSSIIYHFKLMTSCYLQNNPEAFQPFLQIPLDEYCRNVIEVTGQEIDNVGLQALASGVVAPAGIRFEVLYLDRSVGEEVMTYRLGEPATSLPLIELLYRPGHYDLIYKDETPLRVNFQPQLPEFNHQFTNDNYLSDLDAASFLNPDMSLMNSYSSSASPYSESSFKQWQRSASFVHSNASTPPTDHIVVSEDTTYAPSIPPVTTPDDRIRFNPYTFQTEPNTTLTTTVFKNSPFNPNHFKNTSFHPQQYNPEEQTHKPRARRSSSIKSSSSSARPRTGRHNSIKKI